MTKHFKIKVENQKIREVADTDTFKEIAEFNKIDITDVAKILKKASSSFRYSLSQDEMETCCINALWKAIDKYSNDFRCKFTTYLYRGVVMECLTQRKFNKDKISFGGRLHSNIQDDKDHYEPVDMLDEINFACEDPSLILDRYYKNMSIKEIAQNRGVCGETIRIKINKNLKKLRSSLLKSV